MDRRGFLRLLGVGLPALAVGSVLPAAPPQAALEVGLSAVFDGFTHDETGVISSMKYALVESFDRELMDDDLAGVIHAGR